MKSKKKDFRVYYDVIFPALMGGIVAVGMWFLYQGITHDDGISIFIGGVCGSLVSGIFYIELGANIQKLKGRLKSNGNRNKTG